jgi:hypothetical protein
MRKILGDFSGSRKQSEFFTLKFIGISLSIYGISPYEQFSTNELRSKIEIRYFDTAKYTDTKILP